MVCKRRPLSFAFAFAFPFFSLSLLTLTTPANKTHSDHVVQQQRWRWWLDTASHALQRKQSTGRGSLRRKQVAAKSGSCFYSVVFIKQQKLWEAQTRRLRECDWKSCQERKSATAAVAGYKVKVEGIRWLMSWRLAAKVVDAATAAAAPLTMAISSSVQQQK